MDLYVKKSDMPESCAECPLLNGSDECVILDEYLMVDVDTLEELHDEYCPLKAI